MKKTTEKTQPTTEQPEQPRCRVSARAIAAENRAIQAEAKRIAKAAKIVEGFVATDETRKTLMKPWHDKKNGVVVATDGKALIATKHGFNPDAPDGDYPNWQGVVPKYGDEACGVTIDPVKVAEVCANGIRLARAIDHKMNVYAAIPLPEGKHIAFDAAVLRRVAEAMDANSITEFKAVDGVHAILAKNADTTLVAMPIRTYIPKTHSHVSFELRPGRGDGRGIVLNTITGRVISAPERSDGEEKTGRAWADDLRKGLADEVKRVEKGVRDNILYVAITEAWKRGETDVGKVYDGTGAAQWESLSPENKAVFDGWMKCGDKKVLLEKMSEYFLECKGYSKGRKQRQNEIARIEKRIAAEDEIDALMDAPAGRPAPAPETPAAAPVAVPQPEAARPQRKASKPRRAAKPEPQPEAPAVQPSPWDAHAAEWRDMTARNLHDEVRIAISQWAAVNAPSVPEFAMIAADFHLIAARSEGDGYDTDDYMEWRNDETDELLERIGAAFGSEAKAGIAKCL
ncbi:MAG: hypothetical protein IJG84_21255 [Kiritimatiellae bacterium]|nr:hypothetical protein [Kiritimatiellia bacterium]